ncbi:tetratricopeptide repeat protein [Sediminicola luteus]|uniref:Tetratricopeptide repeat protein n=1 Tax=Sediminicola luteus TaxID=319238 RepID=A0A2A4GBE5_9FLAO|nr:hypothetical protein [Sediminicola luteus]PCE65731.1 hypothetical protein B7P33_00035 [Sediminicola luteus]
MEQSELDSLQKAYLQDTLTEAQAQRLAQLRAQGPVLDEKLAFEYDLGKAIALNERKRLKVKLEALEERPKSWRESKSFLAMAASLALLLLTSLLWYLSSNVGAGRDTFEQYYEAYPNTVVSISRSADTNDDIEQIAFAAYDAGDYSRAISALKKLASRSDVPKYHFFLGQAYLAEKEYSAAYGQFKSVMVQGGDFTLESKWYIALLFTRESPEAAIPYLTEIARNKGYKAHEAEELLDFCLKELVRNKGYSVEEAEELRNLLE